MNNGRRTDDVTGAVRCTLGNIVPDGDRTVTLTLQGTEAGEFVGSVAVAAENDADTNNNGLDTSFDIESIAATPTADVAIVQTRGSG